MNKLDLIKVAQDFVLQSTDNYITKGIAISPAMKGLQLYDPPIFGFAATNDPYFQTLLDPSAIGPHFRLPTDWLPTAQTVVSIFLPFTQAVRQGNYKDKTWPSEEWLHGRIEGQKFINSFCSFLTQLLIDAGAKTLVPSLDHQFWSKTGLSENESENEIQLSYTSNWSERHIAFVCGLGTFGLSKGLITEKGVAGRFASLITELYFEPDQRNYSEVYEYCTMCGACIKTCPTEAISFEKGKDHSLCSAFLDHTAQKYKPRYGCGKCQVKVPCEHSIPKR